jgi:hypothetical protein
VTQFHQEKQHVEAMAPLLEASGGSMTIAPYDGAAEFHAESAEAFVRFMKHVYGSSHLVGKQSSPNACGVNHSGLNLRRMRHRIC